MAFQFSHFLFYQSCSFQSITASYGLKTSIVMFILSILKETLDLAFWVSSGDWKISITFIVLFPEDPL